jgi:hypothetical protein
LSWRRVADQYLTLYVSLMIGSPLADADTSGAPASSGSRELTRTLSELLDGAASLIDVGAGDGEATVRALARDDVRRVVAVEPRDEERRAVRRTLGEHGFALDPRLELTAQPIAARSGPDAVTLDDHAAAMESPLVVRVADVTALESVLADASLTLDRPETRWLVAVPAAERERYEMIFRVKGYTVRHLRSRSPATHWIAARR